MNLIDETRELWINRPVHQTMPVVAKATGLTRTWLSDYSQDKGHDYGARKLIKLRDHLLSLK